MNSSLSLTSTGLFTDVFDLIVKNSIKKIMEILNIMAMLQFS